MDYIKYGTTMAVLLTVGLIYDKYKTYIINDEDTKHYELVRQYLLNDSTLAQSKRPIMWIHNEYNQNSRNWKSYGSRNTDDLNQPYLHLTIKSLIDKCGKDFNICLIDDDTFSNVIPDWNINLHLVSDPIKSKLRQLAFARLLNAFGGFLVPSSFLCFENLIDTYKTGIKADRMFVGELLNRSSSSENKLYSPSTQFMGCNKNCKVMKDYIKYLEDINSHDYTDESNFSGYYNIWCTEKIMSGDVTLITADKLGVKDCLGNPITLERLIGNSFIDVCKTAYGLYIPQDEILKRTGVQWFARLSVKQVLESDTNIGKYLLASN